MVISAAPDEQVASSNKGNKKSSRQADDGNYGEPDHKSAGGGGGDDGQRQLDQREVRDRNARRWLSDARTWQAFVRSLTRCAAADPSTQLPQSAGVAVLRAAVFTVRHGYRRTTGDVISGDGGGDRRGKEEGVRDREATIIRELAANIVASKWAFTAICMLCGGGGTAAAAARQAHLERNWMPKKVHDSVREGAPSKEQRTLPWTDACAPGSGAGTAGRDVVTRVDGRSGVGEEQRGEGRALLRMSLDAFVTFLEEVIREHGHRGGGGGSGGGENLGEDISRSLVDGALTQLLRFQVRLQEHQSNRRKVRCTSYTVSVCYLHVLHFSFW